MGRHLQLPTILLAVALPLLCPVQRGAADDEPGQTPDCVDYRGEARYRAYGYDHVVVLESSCREAADCRVSTDVTPDEREVDVPAGDTVEVVTRVGSPAREFTPRVTCTLR